MPTSESLRYQHLALLAAFSLWLNGLLFLGFALTHMPHSSLHIHDSVETPFGYHCLLLFKPPGNTNPCIGLYRILVLSKSS